MKCVALAHPSPDLYGSDRMMLESVHALIRRAKVVVAIPSTGPLCEKLRKMGAEVEIVPCPVLRKSLLSPLGLLRLLVETVRALPAMMAFLRRHRPAALYVNTLTLPLWIAAGRLARVPVICHVHEAEENISPLLRRILVLPVRPAHRVIANSEACLRLLLAGGIRAEHARLVYNGVPVPRSGPPRETPEGRLVLVGRLAPRKGTDVAVQALAELRRRGVPASLTLVGAVFPGYEWFESRLRDLAADLDADLDGSRGVVFAGFQDPAWPHVAAADIVIVPSREEPFGNVAVEGMLAGRPVVASDVQGLAEIIDTGETGLLVPPGDPVALADAVESLLTDWPYALALAEKGRADALTRFALPRYHRDIEFVVLGDTSQD